MNSRTGKLIRQGRILHPETGRGVAIAYSHGMLRGPMPGLRTQAEMLRTLDALAPADAVMVSPGMVESTQRFFRGKQTPALIVQADWHNIGRAQDGEFAGQLGASTAVVTVEQAVAAGADAIMTYLWLGGPDPERERDEIQRNAEFARECQRWGMPLLIESRGVTDERTPDGEMNIPLIRLHSRIAAELGADFVKTLYTGDPESFEQVVDECTVPVLLAGGQRLDTVAEAVSLVRDAVGAGAAGVVFGRNIFQFPDPGDVVRQVRDVVHGGSGRSPRERDRDVTE